LKPLWWQAEELAAQDEAVEEGVVGFRLEHQFQFPLEITLLRLAAEEPRWIRHLVEMETTLPLEQFQSELAAAEEVFQTRQVATVVAVEAEAGHLVEPRHLWLAERHRRASRVAIELEVLLGLELVVEGWGRLALTLVRM